MFLVKQNSKDLINKYNKEDREKLFILKPLYQSAIIVVRQGPFS